MQWTYLEKNGYTGSFNYDTIQGLVPAGSTYSISEDGVTNFKRHIYYTILVRIRVSILILMVI